MDKSMEYFAKIIKHYILLALERGGINIDSDIYAELDEAMKELDAHIKAQVDRQIKTHLVTLAQALGAPEPKPGIPGQQHSMPEFSSRGLATPEPSDRERVERGDRDMPCGNCGEMVDPDQKWRAGIYNEVYCAECAVSCHDHEVEYTASGHQVEVEGNTHRI